MQFDDAAARAVQRDLVRRGYDEIFLAYRGDRPVRRLGRRAGGPAARPQWHRYIPEGNSGHSLILARAAWPARLRKYRLRW